MTSDAELIALYGWCEVCHAPRNRHLIDTTQDGKRLIRGTLICTAHPYDHYPNKDILTEAEAEALRSIR